MENRELYHHGVLGMKWGVRKATNKSSGSTRGRLFRKKSKKPALSDEEKKKLTVEERKASILKSRSAKQLYDNADLFSTQELQSAYNRLVLERNIKSLTPKEISKGKQFVERSTTIGNSIHSVFDTGSKLYNDTAKVYNTFYRGDKDPWPIIKDNDQKKKNNG